MPQHAIVPPPACRTEWQHHNAAQVLAAAKAKNDAEVVDLTQFMALDNPTKAPARSPLAGGRWACARADIRDGLSA